MIDILPYIADKLKLGGIENVELSFNGVRANFPLAVLTETSNVATCADGSEVYSVISVQIDVYAEDKKTAKETAIKVNGILTAAGFRRSSANSLPENGLSRIMMQFRCGIDNTNTIRL